MADLICEERLRKEAVLGELISENRKPSASARHCTVTAQINVSAPMDCNSSHKVLALTLQGDPVDVMKS